MTEGSAFAGISFGYDSDAIFKYRNEYMCSKWKECAHQEFMLCGIKAMVNKNGNYNFKGHTKNYLDALGKLQGIYIQYWAPNKPTRGYSFSGSGLPFPNEEIAYEDTINKGVIKVLQGEFNFHLDYPNSYYSQMGKKLNPPQVKFRFCDGQGKIMSKIYTVILGNSIPFRSLNWPKKRNWNIGPLFYENKDMPVCRTQFQRVIESRYPEDTLKEPANFWGKAVPM